MPIAPSVSIARRRMRSLLSSGWCAWSVSRKWSEMRISGLSRVIGSWKIRPSFGPRSARSCRRGIVTRSCPSNSTLPLRFAASGSSPRTPRPSVDLPQPDSPTRPSVSPRLMSNDTPSTARTAPRAVPYQTRRSRTDRTASDVGTSGRLLIAYPPADLVDDVDREQLASPQHRVEQVVEALPDERQAGHEQHDRQAGVDRRPPDAAARLAERPLEVVAPFGAFRRLDAVPQEAETGQGEQRVGGVEGGDDRNVLHNVAEQVSRDDRPRPGTEDTSRLDVGLLARADDGV